MNLTTGNLKAAKGKTRILLRILALGAAALLCGFFSAAFAQDTAMDALVAAQAQTPAAGTNDENNPSGDDPTTMFPHSESSRYWISGQANVVLQWHPAFPARYNGPNSLRSHAENATSRTFTLYTGLELTHTTEVFVDIESAGGHGISEALGLAGFTNLV